MGTGYRVEIKEVNEEEDKEKKSQWEDYRTVTECKCECIGLTTGNKYKFRIKSKNAKFVSSGRETETITIKEPAEEPFITVKRMFKVTAGSSLVIEGIITGKPEPTVYWVHPVTGAIEENEKFLIQKTKVGSQLTIKRCSR